MDTNLVSQLLQLLISQKASAPAASSNALLIWMAGIAAITPVLAAIATFISNAATRKGQEEAKVAATSTAATVEKIHTDVNSGRTAMIAEHKLEREKFLDEVKALRAEVLEISKEKATLEAQQREVHPSVPSPMPTAPIAVKITEMPPAP